MSKTSASYTLHNKIFPSKLLSVTILAADFFSAENELNVHGEADNFRKFVLQQFSMPYNIMLCESTGSNVCTYNNGGCSHLCLAFPTNYRGRQRLAYYCDCPDNSARGCREYLFFVTFGKEFLMTY